MLRPREMQMPMASLKQFCSPGRPVTHRNLFSSLFRPLHQTHSSPARSLPLLIPLPRRETRLYTTTPPSQPAPQPITTPPALPKRRLGRTILITLFVLLGATGGIIVRIAIDPPRPPIPGTEEDHAYLQLIHERAAALPLIQQLSSDPEWDSWAAYSSTPPESELEDASSSTSRGLVRHTLRGARGVPYQLIFHHPASGETLNIVYFGAGTCGWPGFVHGGALATLLDENMGRCAILQFPARTGVTARLELEYKRPCGPDRFYIVRSKPVKDGLKNIDRKLWVDGTVETMDGHIKVEAKALFVVPKGIDLKPFGDKF